MKSKLAFFYLFLFLSSASLEAGNFNPQVRDDLNTQDFPFESGRLQTLRADYFRDNIQTLIRELPPRSPQEQVLFTDVGLKAGYNSRLIPSLQNKIDRGYRLLMATPAGPWYTQRAHLNHLLEPYHPDVVITNLDEVLKMLSPFQLIQQMYYYWGVTRKTATEIAGQDSSRVIEPEFTYERRTYHTPRGDVVQDIHPKIFLFGKGSHADLEMDSYTFTTNKTFVAVDDAAPADADSRLLSVLIHEIAVVGDQKHRLSVWLRNANGRIPEEWKEASENTAFNLIFSVMRSYWIEHLFFKDLERLDSRKLQMPAVLVPFGNMTVENCERIYHRLVEQPFLKRMGASPELIQQLHDFLPPQSTVPFGRRQRPNACLHFAKPVPGFHNVLSQGPRPRIGGW